MLKKNRNILFSILLVIAVFGFFSHVVARNIWFMPDENKGSFQLKTLRVEEIRAPQVTGTHVTTIYSPTISGTVSGTYTDSATVTMSNKTLTSPTINSGALSGTFSGAPTYSGNATYDDGSGASPSITLTDASDESIVLAKTNGSHATATLDSTSEALQILTGNLRVGNGTPGTTQDGEDAYIEGGLEVDGTVKLDGAVNVTGLITASTGGITDATGGVTAAEIADPTRSFSLPLAGAFVDGGNDVDDASAPNITTLDNIGAILWDDSSETAAVQWTFRLPSDFSSSLVVYALVSSNDASGSGTILDWAVSVNTDDTGFASPTAQTQVECTSATLDASNEVLTLTSDATAEALYSAGTWITLELFNASTNDDDLELKGVDVTYTATM